MHNLDKDRACFIDAMWMIWSTEHKCWWRPRSGGYTEFIENAGRYTFDQATEIVAKANANLPAEQVGPNESMVLDMRVEDVCR